MKLFTQNISLSDVVSCLWWISISCIFWKAQKSEQHFKAITTGCFVLYNRFRCSHFKREQKKIKSRREFIHPFTNLHSSTCRMWLSILFSTKFPPRRIKDVPFLLENLILNALRFLFVNGKDGRLWNLSQAMRKFSLLWNSFGSF